MGQQPMMGQPQQPIIQQPMIQQPVAQQPVAQQPVVVQQPVQTGKHWMPQVAAIQGCPPGLEYLTQLDQVWVKQTKDLLEMVLPWEVANSYRVFNAHHQQCYYAFEVSNVLCRQYCGTKRSFSMKISDNAGQLIFSVDRPWACWSQFICDDEVTVSMPDGSVLGKVSQNISCWKGSWEISDQSETPRFRIKGPCCNCTMGCGCCSTADYNIYELGNDEEPIGKISKEWSGFIAENFTDADNFGVYFPLNLEVEMKATFIGAVFLIDFMYYESGPQKQNDDKTSSYYESTYRSSW